MCLFWLSRGPGGTDQAAICKRSAGWTFPVRECLRRWLDECMNFAHVRHRATPSWGGHRSIRSCSRVPTVRRARYKRCRSPGLAVHTDPQLVAGATGFEQVPNHVPGERAALVAADDVGHATFRDRITYHGPRGRRSEEEFHRAHAGHALRLAEPACELGGVLPVQQARPPLGFRVGKAPLGDGEGAERGAVGQV